MATASTNSAKRDLDEAELHTNNPSKKRKLNEESTLPLPAKIDSSAHSTATNTNTANDKDKDNEDPQKWSFKASDFTFGDNTWVKQTSDPSISTTPTTNDSKTSNDKAQDKEEKESSSTTKEINLTTNDSFSGFVGMGFGKELESKKKEEEKDKKTKTEADDKANPWAQNWSNSKADGSFKLNFEWGTWEDSNTKIDLNPANKIGYGSEAKVYDGSKIEPDEKTKAVLDSMTGEQDAGDADDKNVISVHCKVYSLENGQAYCERGKGMVNVNTYLVGDKLKGRILCRRDQILTNIINAPILKEMKFEKAGNFLRFGVLEQVAKAKAVKKDGDDNEEEEDDDIAKPKVVPFLIKPSRGGKEKIDEMLKKIEDMQKTLS